MAFATVLVHDRDPGRARRIPGSVCPALDELGIEPRVASFVSAPDAVPDPAEADVVVVMGSSESADDDALPWLGPELAYLHRAVELGTPVLGICFGGQALSRVLGGTVGRAPRAERGFVDLGSLDPATLAPGRWMQFHRDAFTLPPGARPLARNDVCLQAFAAGPHLGVQFHPEITSDVFAAWGESYAEKQATLSAADRASVPDRSAIEAIAAEIDERADAGPRACRELVAGFVDRAASPAAS
jgi:GMP synthase (glutamine-hydrolysing)